MRILSRHYPTHSFEIECLKVVLLGEVHDDGPKLVKEFALKGFSKKISNHVLCWAVFDGKFTVPNSVCNKIETHLYMFRPFSTGLPTVVFEKDGTLVILIKYRVVGRVTLILKKVIGPEKGGHEIVDSDDLGFS